MPRHLLALLFTCCGLLSLVAGEDPTQPMPRVKDYNWMSVQAWNERHAKYLEMIKSGGGDLLFVGDSITEGWGGAGKDVWAKEYAPGMALNIGIGGDTTQNVLWRLANGEVEGLKPKVVVLMIGTNNFGLHQDQPKDVIRGVTAVVASLREKLPGAHVLLLGIFPRDANPQAGIRAKIAEVNTGIMKLDDGKAVHYLDISKAFTEADGSLKKEIMPDFLHLSGEGYQRWADAIRQPLKELLAKPLAAGK
jgi:lysophospholipase L1-like esterase